MNATHHEVNSALGAGMVLSWLTDTGKITALEEVGGHSFVIRTQYTSHHRYRITVDRIPDGNEQDAGIADEWEGDPHRHPGQFAGLMCHDHGGFGYHCHDLNPPPSWGVGPGEMYIEAEPDQGDRSGTKTNHTTV